jgi:ferredoxin-like protein FixX
MKPKINAIQCLAALSFFMALSSFALMPGGDYFEVYLNNKMVLQETLHNRKATPPLLLDETSTDQLHVYYSHCGETGTSRKITLKDAQNKSLKEWKYPDVDKTVKDAMSCSVKEITAFKKGGHTLTLFYSAKESANEVALAPIQWLDKTASNN